MTKPTFSVKQIDHVELLVPNRYDAARWYENFLGLTIMKDFEDWADPNGNGPLMISSDDGATKLALFEGMPQGAHPIIGYQLTAFRVDGLGFMQFLSRLDDYPLFNAAGKRLTAKDFVNHDRAFSIYFCDPYGNHLEITSYDYQYILANT